MEYLVKGEYRNNLKKVIKMLSTNEHVKNNIDMDVYQYNDDHDDELPLDAQQYECQTTGCVLGHSLRLLNHNEFLIMNQKSENGERSIYRQLVEAYFGIEYYGIDWSFLFGARWLNDASYCIKRIQYYLDNDMKMDRVISTETGDYDYLFAKTTIDFK